MSEESSSSAKDIPEQSSTRYRRDDSGTKVVMRETKVYDESGGVISRSREYLISHHQKSSFAETCCDVCAKIIVIVIAIIIGIGLGIMMS